jgi:hypothetical protein
MRFLSVILLLDTIATSCGAGSYGGGQMFEPHPDDKALFRVPIGTQLTECLDKRLEREHWNEKMIPLVTRDTGFLNILGREVYGTVLHQRAMLAEMGYQDYMRPSMAENFYGMAIMRLQQSDRVKNLMDAMVQCSDRVHNDL